MIKEIKLVVFSLYWAALIGGILPYLISAKNTELVIAGFALLIVSAYVTYRLARKALTKEKKSDA
ncbi:hypothetical protein [Xanthomonas virus PB119]|nr:hypothetical protein [Xanthomonas virus PB119]